MATSVNLEAVTQAATDAIREHSFPVSVLGAVPSDDSNYTEVVLRINGCHEEPCRLQVGVFRNAQPDAMRMQIAEKIRDHLSHR